MCHFIISKDVYTECLLWEKQNPEKAPDAPSGSEEQPKQPEPEPEPTLIPRLLRLIRDNRPPVPDTPTSPVAGPSDEAPAGNETRDSNEPEYTVHIIKQKTIFQCSDARNNTNIEGKEPDERYCSEAEGTKMIEAESDDEDTPYSSTVKGRPCPVCTAAEEAVERELNRVLVLPYKPKTTPDKGKATPEAGPSNPRDSERLNVPGKDRSAIETWIHREFDATEDGKARYLVDLPDENPPEPMKNPCELSQVMEKGLIGIGATMELKA